MAHLVSSRPDATVVFGDVNSTAELPLVFPVHPPDLIKSIRSTVAKMNALIAKLKAFPEKMELKREAVELARVAQETLEEIRRVKPAIAFQAECAPVEAQGDAQEMKKVVLNLSPSTAVRETLDLYFTCSAQNIMIMCNTL